MSQSHLDNLVHLGQGGRQRWAIELLVVTFLLFRYQKTPRLENIFTRTCVKAEEEENMPKNCNAAISAIILMIAKASCALLLNFKKIQFCRWFYDTLG
jgi:hypothetical protein